jgi:hypothetical protein
VAEADPNYAGDIPGLLPACGSASPLAGRLFFLRGAKREKTGEKGGEEAPEALAQLQAVVGEVGPEGPGGR